jgi:hypothetical protein
MRSIGILTGSWAGRYALQVPVAGQYSFNTCASQINTVVLVYESGTSPPGIGRTVGACDDGACTFRAVGARCGANNNNEQFTVSLSVGTYVIQVSDSASA